jgi:hypothetical protein
MSQSGHPLLRNVYNKNSYFSGNGVKTIFVSAKTNMVTTTASEAMKQKDSTRCLLDGPADRTDRIRQMQRDSRNSRAKKAPDRRGPKQREELAELRGDSRHTVKTDIHKSDTGRQLK